MRDARNHVLTVVALGTPAPQGSKRHVGNGRMIESSKQVAPWREAVKFAAFEAMRGAHAQQPVTTWPLRGPLAAQITFTLRKPASAPKRTRTWPSRKPDLDKLVRSTFDALTDAGVWIDDSLVIDVRAVKAFPRAEDDWSAEHPDALTAPGAVIRVHCITDPAPPQRPQKATGASGGNFGTSGRVA